MFYVLAGASVGGVIVLRRRRVTIVPLIGVIVAVAVTVGVVYGTTRFRTPAEVPIVLLAAVAFDETIRFIRARRGRETPDEPPTDRPGHTGPTAAPAGAAPSG